MSEKYKLEDIKKNIKTGDIILFAGNELDSRIIRRFIKTKWCHVGMAIRIEDWDILLLWEYSPTVSLSDSISGNRRRGVQVVPLDQRLKTYNGEFSIRHLHGVDVDSDLLMKRTLVTYKKQVDSNYIDAGFLSSWKFRIRFAFDAVATLFLGKDLKKEAINCSHMLAESYQRMGLLPKTKPSRLYTPYDFTEEANLKLKRGYLSNQIEVEV